MTTTTMTPAAQSHHDVEDSSMDSETQNKFVKGCVTPGIHAAWGAVAWNTKRMIRDQPNVMHRRYACVLT